MNMWTERNHSMCVRICVLAVPLNKHSIPRHSTSHISRQPPLVPATAALKQHHTAATCRMQPYAEAYSTLALPAGSVHCSLQQPCQLQVC
jgi:hypothetical protein